MYGILITLTVSKGLVMEKYFNINTSGRSIRCKIYCKDLKSVKKAVINIHGFSGHKDNKAAQRFAEYVLKKRHDTAIIAFNLPCHGDDVRKTILLSDCDLYIKAVIDYIKSRFSTEDIYVYTTSFGGYLTLKYIAEHGNPFKKIAMRCPAVNMYEVLSGCIMSPAEQKALSNGKPVLVGFDRKIKIYGDFLDDLKANDITEYDYTPYSEKLLILHGTKDEVVSFDASEEFAKKNNIEFIPIENADHRFKDPNLMNEAIKIIFGFLQL